MSVFRGRESLLTAAVVASVLLCMSCGLFPMPEAKYEFLKDGPPAFLYDDFERNDGEMSTRYYYELGGDSPPVVSSTRPTSGMWSCHVVLANRLSISVTSVHGTTFSYDWMVQPGSPVFGYPGVEVDGVQQPYSGTGSMWEVCRGYLQIPAGTHVVTFAAGPSWDDGYYLDNIGTYAAYPFSNPSLYFFHPCGIVLDSTERIYVADAGHTRIIRMNDMTGSGFTTYGTSGSGTNQFTYPAGIALDRTGGIYVTDSSLGRLVHVHDMNGAAWTTYAAGLSGPRGVFVASDDRIYLADSGNNRIVRIDNMSGANFTAYGTGGSGTGMFSGPTDVALDSGGRIYVADRGNNRIVRIDDMTGTGWVTCGAAGSSAGQLSSPTSVAIGSGDAIHIVDTGNNRVVRISGMSAENWTVLGYARGTGPLHDPVDVAFDADGLLYVTNDVRAVYQNREIVSFGVP
jgi:streptogramin lyase